MKENLNINMNTYCAEINIPIQPLLNFDVYDPWRARRTMAGYANLEYISLERLNPELVDYLSKRNLQVSQVDILYCEPGQSHAIHVDQPYVENFIEGDYVRINWIYGGSDSKMIWYRLKDPANKPPSNRMIYNKDHVEEIYSQTVLGTQIVQIGVPHTVMAGSERRYAVCCHIVSRNISPSRVTMARALEIFQDIIV
jgi:hypothetical protein